jgi:major type 1 subunit fimbrin (pilin)
MAATCPMHNQRLLLRLRISTAPLQRQFVFLAFYALMHASALAQPITCGNIGISFSPSLPNPLIVTPKVGSTVWSGKIVATMANCSQPKGSRFVGWNLSSAASRETVFESASSLSIGYTGPSSMAATPTVATQDQYHITYMYCAGSAAVCSYNAIYTVPAAITVKSLPIAAGSKIGAAGGPNYSPLTRALSNRVAWLWQEYVNSGPLLFPQVSMPTVSVVAQGCTLAVLGATVALPTVSSSALAQPGSTAGSTPFKIKLDSCAGTGSAYMAKATWSFAQGPTPTSLQNSSTNPASNVFVELLDSSSRPLRSGDLTDIGLVSASGGSAEATFSARYVSSGAATPGGVVGVATFTLSYQ